MLVPVLVDCATMGNLVQHWCALDEKIQVGALGGCRAVLA